jgi:hypothetical protein
MKMITSVLAASLSILSGLAQDTEQLKLDNKLSILNDRAFFTFPTEAKNSARGTDIMSADPNQNQETRIVLDIGKMRLVFFAQELYSLGDKDLFSQVSSTSRDLTHKVLLDKDQLLSILSTPLTFDSTQEAILVNRLLVKTPDNTVFSIGAYINPAGLKMKHEFIGLTERVFRTLSNGTRVNTREAHSESLNIFGTKKNFTFYLPENYCVTVDQKYDFQVFKFHKYQSYTDTNWVSLIIYVGGHPSFFYREYGFDKTEASEVNGKFLNENIKWMSFKNTSKGLVLMEQQIPSGNIDKGLIVHIAMTGSNSSLVNELIPIVEGIKLKKN